jgi:hypothetical protein
MARVQRFVEPLALVFIAFLLDTVAVYLYVV